MAKRTIRTPSAKARHAEREAYLDALDALLAANYDAAKVEDKKRTNDMIASLQKDMLKASKDSYEKRVGETPIFHNVARRRGVSRARLEIHDDGGWVQLIPVEEDTAVAQPDAEVEIKFTYNGDPPYQTETAPMSNGHITFINMCMACGGSILAGVGLASESPPTYFWGMVALGVSLFLKRTHD